MAMRNLWRLIKKRIGRLLNSKTGSDRRPIPLSGFLLVFWAGYGTAALIANWDRTIDDWILKNPPHRVSTGGSLSWRQSPNEPEKMSGKSKISYDPFAERPKNVNP